MIRSYRRSVLSRSLLVGVVMVATLAAPAYAQEEEDATSFSGEATVVDVLVENPLGGAPLVDLILGEAGPLPAEGGEDSEELVDVDEDVAELATLTASLIRAETEGFGSTAESSATIADLALTIMGDPLGLTEDLLDVSSTTLESTATARCTEDGAEVEGDSVIEDLSINGTDIVVSGEPNQEVVLLEGLIEIVINEQIEDVADDGTFGDITVNALRITVFDPLDEEEVLAEIILASSHADVTCMPDSSTDGLFSVTSGSTGTSGSQLPLMVLIVAGVAVSFMLTRSFARR
ncbi:MAG: hypothetical protein M3395_04020 [Chloroflexota bacterium]|nr:hypothetical protein [Chloroflexota bacterium]MDQ3691989.1 hypothetical protein [Chloroflexota bacterium]